MKNKIITITTIIIIIIISSVHDYVFGWIDAQILAEGLFVIIIIIIIIIIINCFVIRVALYNCQDGFHLYRGTITTTIIIIITKQQHIKINKFTKTTIITIKDFTLFDELDCHYKSKVTTTTILQQQQQLRLRKVFSPLLLLCICLRLLLLLLLLISYYHVFILFSLFLLLLLGSLPT